MNINFVVASLDGCNLYRCQNWVDSAMKYKTVTDGDINTQTHKPRADILDADVVVFQRPNNEIQLEMMRMLKIKGKIVIFDNDDTWKLPKDHFVRLIAKEKLHMECLLEADIVTTTTLQLKKEYEKVRDNVHVIKNVINFNRIPEAHKRNNKKLRVLFSGSVFIGREVDDSLLKMLAEDNDIELVLFGNHQLLKNKYNAEIHDHVTVDKYFDKLNDLKIDVSLIPRNDNYFNRCKSNIKYLEMSALKIATICSGYKGNPYALTKKEGAPIVLTKNDWQKEIHKMKDKTYREVFQEANYNWVKENYILYNQYEQFIDSKVQGRYKLGKNRLESDSI